MSLDNGVAKMGSGSSGNLDLGATYGKGAPVPTKTGTASNGTTNTTANTSSADDTSGATVSTSYTENDILNALDPKIDPAKSQAAYDKFDLKAAMNISGIDGVRFAANVDPNKRFNAKQDDLILALASPGALYGIGGMPAPFIDPTDPPSRRLQNGVGYFYLQHNIRYGQFIAFKPGWVRWSLSGSDAQAIQAGNTAVGTIASVMSGNIYQNVPLMEDYWRDVSRACRVCIYMMGLQDTVLEYIVAGGVKGNSRSEIMKQLGNNGQGSINILLGAANRLIWRNIGLGLSNAIVNRTAYAEIDDADKQDAGFVAFFVNGQIESSDSLQNQTGASPFKEALDAMAGSATGMVREVASKMFGAGQSNNANVLDYIVGNPLIPDVWSDSTFDKSYTVPLKFVSSAGDPVSIFMNIMFPLIKLLMLALPSGTGGFIFSPAIHRVFSQSAINTDYGIISGLQIQKNMTTLNDYGQPTEVTVTMTVTDLMPRLFKEKPGWFIHSVNVASGFSTFIATMCGVNVTTLTRNAKKVLAKKLAKLDGFEAGTTMIVSGKQYVKDVGYNAFMPIRDAFNGGEVSVAGMSGLFSGILKSTSNPGKGSR